MMAKIVLPTVCAVIGFGMTVESIVAKVCPAKSAMKHWNAKKKNRSAIGGRPTSHQVMTAYIDARMIRTGKPMIHVAIV